jgi:hypothetical protein
MAYQYFGNPPVTQISSQASNLTIIDASVPSPGRGIMKEAEVFSGGAGTIKVKVFRNDGTNYIYVGESPAFTLAPGLNVVPCMIPVEKGDLIGFAHTSGATVSAKFKSSGKSYFRTGDIAVDSAKTLWASVVRLYSIRGWLFSRGIGL